MKEKYGIILAYDKNRGLQVLKIPWFSSNEREQSTMFL